MDNTRRYQLTDEERSVLKDAMDLILDDLDTVINAGHQPETVMGLVEKLKEPIPPQPLWRGEPFTEEDQNNMAMMMMEEVRDSVKQYAHDDLDQMEDYTELVGYADLDPQATAAFLQAIVDSDGCDLNYPVGYEPIWDFCTRMDLIRQGQQGDYLTDHGEKYLKEYK